MNNLNLKDILLNIKEEDINEYSLCGLETIGKIVSIYDGDTCKIVLINDNKLYKYNCRLYKIDSPEMKPSLKIENRENEIIGAYRARNYLIQLTTDIKEIKEKITKKELNELLKNNKRILNVKCREFDKYGRLLVELYDPNDIIESINDKLIKYGYAKEYYGGKKN